jgi:uncharacterized protein (TIGR00255 family)
MLNSMTGYGEATCQFEGVVYSAEIRTVNNRYYKSRVRVPEAAAFLEGEIDQLLRKELSRGTVNYSLTQKDLSSERLFDINEVALSDLVKRLLEISSSSGEGSRIDIGSLLHLPGIVQPVLPDETLAAKLKEFVLDVTGKALEQLKEMRAREGVALLEDLAACCKAMNADLETVRSLHSVTGADYAAKLKKRIDELLSEVKAQIDEETLAREVAIFVDRTDISEEITRLQSHLDQFAEICEGEGNAGRRLDFICQEMLREANTIASKAFDIKIIHAVVDMKCQIDRLKEQVQNIE